MISPTSSNLWFGRFRADLQTAFELTTTAIALGGALLLGLSPVNRWIKIACAVDIVWLAGYTLFNQKAELEKVRQIANKLEEENKQLAKEREVWSQGSKDIEQSTAGLKKKVEDLTASIKMLKEQNTTLSKANRNMKELIEHEESDAQDTKHLIDTFNAMQDKIVAFQKQVGTIAIPGSDVVSQEVKKALQQFLSESQAFTKVRAQLIQENSELTVRIHKLTELVSSLKQTLSSSKDFDAQALEKAMHEDAQAISHALEEKDPPSPQPPPQDSHAALNTLVSHLKELHDDLQFTGTDVRFVRDKK